MHAFAFLTSSWIGFISLFGLFHQAQLAPSAAPWSISAATTSETTTHLADADVQGTSAAQIEREGQAEGAAISSSSEGDVGAASSDAISADTTGLPATGSAWLTSLPLGDGKYVTDAPQQGSIYLCHVATGGKGAQGSASWIHGSTWSPAEKVAVEGSVSWPDASYSMQVADGTRTITANGLPTDHTTGIFPIKKSDPAYQFDANPNSIAAQAYFFSFPADPVIAPTPDCIYGQVGIMNDGVPLFDGFDAEYRDAVAHETQDAYEAHPDEAGAYHYHGFESGYVKDPVSEVVGFAFDGFPITGAALPDGTYLTTADLDECHGLTSAVMLDGKNTVTYHYVLTQDFPYSVSCFRGKSYEPRPSGSGSYSGGTVQQQGPGPTGGMQQRSILPEAAISACAGKQDASMCSFTTPNGTVSGACTMPPGQDSLACAPR